MRFQIKGYKTLAAGEDLCKTCTFSTCATFDDNTRAVYCSQLDTRLSKRVSECNRYKKKGEPTVWDMKEIAWVLRTEKSGRAIGFARPRDLRDKERDDLERIIDPLDY